MSSGWSDLSGLEKKGYNAADFNDWVVDGHRAGEFKTYGNLTVSLLD